MKKILKGLTIFILIASVVFALVGCKSKDLDEEVSIFVSLKSSSGEIRILDITTKKANLHEALLEYIKTNNTIEYNYSGMGSFIFITKLWKVQGDNAGGYVCLYHNLNDSAYTDDSGFYQPITFGEIEYKASNASVSDLPVKEGAQYYIFYAVYSS